MPKTASDPFFATNQEPVTAGRHSKVFAAGSYAGTDLPSVSSSLIISATAAGNLSVIMANDNDASVITFPITAGISQVSIQVRQIVTVPASCTVVALWS
jgi:hypothetical protein